MGRPEDGLSDQDTKGAAACGGTTDGLSEGASDTGGHGRLGSDVAGSGVAASARAHAYAAVSAGPGAPEDPLHGAAGRWSTGCCSKCPTRAPRAP
ncbi:hypothetical protein GCM10017776_30950 [Streptomyces griseoluteus]|nr:hypothetical protein GCM10017776_30950 [Streptomyces griseoluteus]